ncbi:MAG: hypothetical protein E4H14_20340, partial [Candidatus Thorarchaeota archaeon]
MQWVGLSYEDRLTNSESDAGKFYHHMGVTGEYSQEFNWGEWNAWESDFRDATENDGNDSEWVDCVDFVYYKGHGNPISISFTSDHDSHYADFNEMKLGDG